MWTETTLSISRGIVGTVLHDPRRLDEAATLTVEDCGPRMGKVWAAIRNIEAVGGVIAPTTVTERIRLDGHLEQHQTEIADVLVSEALVGAVDCPYPAHTVEGLAQCIREVKRAARGHRLAMDTAQIAGSMNRGDITLEQAEAQLHDLLSAQPTEEIANLATIAAKRAEDVADLHARRAAGESVFTGVPTGFSSFDRTYGGLPRGVVSVLGADTGIGKSAFARAFAYGAVKSGAGCALIFSLEDGNDNLADRVLGEQTGMGATKIRQLDFEEKDKPRLDAAARQPLLDQIYVEDSCYEVDDICHRARAFSRKHKIALIVIDYIQLVSMPGAGSDTIAIKRALLALQMLAKHTNAAVLVLSQVTTKAIANRGQEYYFKAAANGTTGDDLYEGYVPGRGDFAWASELDQYGKMVMSGFRAGPYKRQHTGERDEDKSISLRVLKANFGPSGKRFTFKWIPELAQVADSALSN